MLKVRTVAEVQGIIRKRFGSSRSGSESVSLEAALGRMLAEDIASAEFVPDFNRSTVDGYAVRAADVFGCSDFIPALLTLAGAARMGEHTAFQVTQGQCAYVPTGAELPAGADAMVMLEHTEDFGEGVIAVSKPVAPGANLIFRGDDVKPGECILPAGRRLAAADLGTCAALGIMQVPVMLLPRAAIISTGDELVPAGQFLAPGRIRDVNAPMLSALVAEAGGQARFLGIIPDDEVAILSAVGAAVPDCDLLLISGGTSVGVKDALPSVIASLGMLLVHGLAAKPGKPTILGVIRGKPVFGLPGNPVAAFFMFHMLVRPLLFSMQGAQAEERTLSAPLARAFPSNHGREEFVPVTLKDGAVHPIAAKSGLVTMLARADGFIRIPRDCEGLEQNELVDVILFKR